MMDPAVQPTTPAPSGTQTTAPAGALAVGENAAGAVRGRGLEVYRQETLQIQGSNQIPQAQRNNATCAAAAARRPPFEAPTWRHFAGDWR